jgi:predicted acetyltransferase
MRVENFVVGFALVRRDEKGVTEMAEYWLCKPWRGKGFGRAACAVLFAAHPGSWRIRCFPFNAAEAFWSAVVPPNAGNTRKDEHLVFTFVTEASSSNNSFTPTSFRGAA